MFAFFVNVLFVSLQKLKTSCFEICWLAIMNVMAFFSVKVEMLDLTSVAIHGTQTFLLKFSIGLSSGNFKVYEPYTYTCL